MTAKAPSKKNSPLKEKKVYNLALLKEAAQIKIPTERTPLKFTVEKIAMDDDFCWTLNLNFKYFFSTFDSEYNLVIFRDPDSFNSSINSIIEGARKEAEAAQTSIDDLADVDDPDLKKIKIHPVDEINKKIKMWNDAIDLLGVTNIKAELKKYDKKNMRSKDLTFIIHSSSVDYFKDRFQKQEAYVACLEVF